MRPVQPGSDHTALGQCCFATGLARGAGQGDNDVDGGCATLETSPLDLSGLGDATLRFWLWFSNHTGERPHDDSFIVRASSDGGAHWSDLFLTREGAGCWRRIVLPLDEKLALTRDVRFRFIASDSLADAVVEALIDDIEILTGTRESTDVADDHGVPGGPATSARLRLAPNPTRDRVTVRLDLGAAQRIEAVIFDAGGRLLRRLWSGTLPAGRSELVWDARDGAERPVAAGVYWLEVVFEQGRERERRRIVVIR
ncbi:MAG: FlgD immunoglobulin-like domain containing protein [Candidatus Eisenbacteria bacterium]